MKFISKHVVIQLAYIGIDLFFLYLSIYGACWARQELLSFPVRFDYLLFESSNYFRLIFIAWLVSVIFVNNANNLYQTRRELGESVEVWTVVKSVGLAALLIIVVKYIFKIEGFPRTIFVITVLSQIFFLSLWRILKRYFVNFLVSRGYNNFNAVIIGAGKVGRALAHEIQAKPELGIKVIGFLDDFKIGTPYPDSSLKVLGKLSDFMQISRKEFVNKVFITIHHDSRVFLNLLEQAKDLHVTVRVVPQGFELTTGEFCKYNIGFIPILEYCDAEHSSKQSGKRIFDLFMGLCAFILFLPILLVIALMIKLDSPGPVFYQSQRYGRGGRIFKMYKFRSMVFNADDLLPKLHHQNEVDGPIFKIKKDPRVTPFGQILRKYSLDELPQIINVVKGEMSFVGPRPLPIHQVEKEDFRQLKRLEVRPGITGLWQIRGRSDISFSRLLRWDIWYINNWSFWLDLNILFQTFPVVIKGKGAY